MNSFDFSSIFPDVENLLKNSLNSSVSCLNDKEVVGLYFSAHWCHPCRGFTPVLVQAYKQLQNLGKSFEIVFISSDKDEEQFLEYYKEMPWVALPFIHRSLKESLAEEYECDGIPHLVLLNGKTGEIITTDGRQVLTDGGPEAFPFTEEAIESGKELKKAKKQIVFADWKVFQEDFDVCELKTKEAIVLFFGHQAGTSGVHVFKAIEKAHSQLKERLAVVYIPTQEEGYDDFVSKMPSEWYKLKKGSKAVETLKSSLSFEDPLTIVLNNKAQILNDQASRTIYENLEKGFPWTKEALEAAAKQKEEELNELQKLQQQSGLKFLEGANIVSKDGTSKSLESLNKLDLVGLYFSAHWCPPCRKFTPTFAQEYNTLKTQGKNIDVVFISSDKDQNMFNEYYQEMPWLALDFSQRSLKEKLAKIFKCDGIPYLVFVNPKTGQISENGRDMIKAGAEYYPWTEELLKEAKQNLEAKEQKILQDKKNKESEVIQCFKNNKTVVLRSHQGISEISANYQYNSDSFYTVVGDVKLGKGKYYYEVKIEKMGDCSQFGWYTEGFFAQKDKYTGTGMGDDKFSWGLDGARLLKWHKAEDQSFGSEWKNGDIIGLAVDVETKTFTLSVNGSYDAPNGVAFTGGDQELNWVSPGLTGPGKYSVNFGDSPFTFQPPSQDYQSVHQAYLSNL